MDQPETTLVAGDKFRLSVRMIQTLQRKWAGLSLVVEVTSITEGSDGVKLLSVREPLERKSA